MANTVNVSTSDGQTPNAETVDPQGQTATPSGQTPNGSQNTPIDSLPPDVQDYIRRLRAEAEDANKKTKAEARAKQQAEEARLREQGEYKQLAEKHQTRVQELEPVAERYSALASLVAEQITVETKDWPDELKIFDPGADAPVEQRLTWLQKSRPLVFKLTQQTNASRPGNGPNPRPANAQTTQETAQQANRAAFVTKRSYGF